MLRERKELLSGNYKMNKVIITVGGSREAKNAFQKTLKEKLNYWVWNVNSRNELQFVIGLLGWDGQNKDEKYQEVFKQLYTLAETSYDFRKTYIARMIDRFLAHDRAQVLIIHQAEDMIEDLKLENGILSLYVARNKGEMEINLNKYDKIILLDEFFENNVKNTMEILIK